MSDSESESDNEQDEDRMRDLLASYYGMQNKGGDDISGGGSGVSSQKNSNLSNSNSVPTNIDDASFEPNQYVRQLLKTSPLDTLLRRNDELVHEVKGLDSDMQMLVYENYNKFISATDTIRKMKGDVEAMESDMSDLVDRMTKVGAKSEVVNGSLSEKRLRIDKLVRVRRLLQRLEFIFDLPAKLNQCIDVGNFSQAVKYYVMSEAVLRNYSHLSSFQNIQRDANETIARLKTELIKALDESHTCSPDVTAERVGLLLKLKVEPTQLRGALLSSIKHLMTTSIEASMKVDEEAKNEDVDDNLPKTENHGEEEGEGEEAGEEGKKESPLLKRVTKLTDAVAAPLVQHVKAFKTLFEQTEEDRDLPASDLTRKIATDESNRKAAQAECEELVIGVASSYLAAARQLFGEEGSSEPDPMAVVETIEALRVVVEAAKKLNSIALNAGILDRSVEIVEYIVRFEIDKGFRWLREEAVSRIAHLYEHRDQPNDVVASSLKKLAQVLKALQPLLDAGNTVTSEADSAHFGALAANNVWMFSAWFGDALESMCDVTLKFDPCLISTISSSSSQLSSQVAGLGIPTSSVISKQNSEEEEDSVNPLFVLDCAMICTSLCRDMLPKCDMLITRCIRDGGVELSGDMELENHLRTSALRLTVHFVEVIGGELADRVQDVLKHSNKSGTSSDNDEELSVRKVFVDVMQQIDEIALEVAVVLGTIDKETLEPKSGNELPRVLGFSPNAWSKGNDREMVRRLNTASSNASNVKGGVFLDIERVFSERVVIFSDDIQLNVPSLLFSIFKPFLKGIIECLRCLTFRHEKEFQQIQLDVQFLRIGVAYFIGDGPMENRAIVDALLDEVLVSASERCVMDPADASLEVKRLVTLSNSAAADINLRSNP